jgi:hypothetical protein
MTQKKASNWQDIVFTLATFSFLFAVTVFTYQKIEYGRTIASNENIEKYIYNFSYKF